MFIFVDDEKPSFGVTLPLYISIGRRTFDFCIEMENFLPVFAKKWKISYCWPHGEMHRTRRRTALRAERTEQDQPGGRRVADFGQRGNPQTLHHPTDRTSGNPAPTPQTENNATIQKIIFNPM